MPITEVKGPDGRLYQVEHPRGALESQIIKIAQSQAGPAPRRNTAVGNLLRAMPAGLAQSGYDSINELGQEIVGISAQREKAKFAFDAWAGNPSEKDKSLEDIEKRMRENQAAIQKYVGDTGDFAGEAFGVEEGRLSADIGRGIGQLPLMFITRGASAVPMAMTEVRKDAEETFATDYADMSDEQRDQVQLAQGLYSAFALVLNRIGLEKMGLGKLDDFFKAGKTVKGSVVKKVLKDSTKGSVGEFITEAAEAAAQDQFARIYDPNRDYSWDDVKRYLYEGFVGGIVGGTVATGVSAAKTFSGGIIGVPVEENESGSSESTEGSAPLGNYRTVEVTYKQLDGTVRVVPISVNEGDNQQEVAEKELAGRYDPAYGVTVADIEPRVFSQEPDPTQEQVPVEPEAAAVPAAVEPAQQQAPVLNTVQVDLQGLQPEELQNVVQQLRQKLVNAREAESQGKSVLGGSASIEADLNNVKSYIASSEAPAQQQAPEQELSNIQARAKQAGMSEEQFRNEFPDVVNQLEKRQQAPAQQQAPAPATRSFSLPQNLKKGKPGYAQTQNITFASDLERATYSATTATQSDPAIRKRQQYRNLLKESGYSDTEINTMGREVRAQMKGQYKGKGSPIFVSLKQDVTAEASATYIPKRFVGDQAGKAPPFFQSFSPEQYDEGRFVDLETKQDLSNKTFKGGSIRIEGGRPILETSDNASETIINSKASKEGPLVRTNLFKQAAGWKWTKAPDGAPSTLVSVERGDHYYTLSFISNKPLTLKTYPDKENEPRGRPTTRGKLKLGKKVGEIRTTPSKWHPKGKLHPVYDTITVGEPDVVAEAATSKPKAKKVTRDYDLLSSPFISNYSGPGPTDTSVPDYGSFHYVVSNPQQQELNAAIASGAVDYLADQVANEAAAMMNDPAIAAGIGWYGRMRQRLKEIFGNDIDIFTQLLGTTSAQTPVETNFRFSVDLYNRFKAGEFDANIKEYLKLYGQMKAGTLGDLLLKDKVKNSKGVLYTPEMIKKSEPSALLSSAAEHYNLEPAQTSGKKYGTNSYPALKALAQVWFNERLSKDKMTPKTPQFTMNLNGESLEATIDVWAARLLRRVIYAGQADSRILPSQETAVNNPDFALGQLVFRRAAQKLNMNPDDLQALVWFGEKQIWDRNGWTGAAGALKSSFDEPADVFYPVDGSTRSEADANLILDFLAKERLVKRDIEFPDAVTKTRQNENRKEYDQFLRQRVISDYLKSRGSGAVYESSSVESNRKRQVTRSINRLSSYTGKVSYKNGTGKEPKGSLKVVKRGPVLGEDRFARIAKANKDGNKFGSSVDVFKASDYKGYDLIITSSERGESVTMAISPDGELSSVTKSSNATAQDVDAAFDMAISTGKVKFLNGFETVLPIKYASYGFTPVARLKFNPEFQPDGWSTQTYRKFNGGQPDVVFMRFDGTVGSEYDRTGFPEVDTYEEGVRLANQEDVTAQATDTAVEDRGPRDTYDNGGQVQDAIEKEFDPIGKKINTPIKMRMKTDYVARYNATRGIIEYNPLLLLQRTKAGIRAAMREEMIHAAMHQVLMVSALKKFSMAEGGKVWTDFFGEFGKSLTDVERSDIKDVYQNIDPEDYVAYGSEYSRAVIQNLLYGEFSEQYVMESQGGSAWDTVVKLLRSVQAYMAKVLGPMIKTNPEAAQVIVDSVELLKAVDPALRPKSQDVVAQAYDATDKNTAKENTGAGEIVAQGSEERIAQQRKWFDNDYRKTASQYLTPIITRLNSIHPEFGRIVQNLDTAIRKRIFTYQKQTEQFFKRLNSIKGDEFVEVQRLIFFSPTPAEANLAKNREKMDRRDAILQKYGLLNMYRLDVQPILEQLFVDYSELGMPDMGYLQQYFPRSINDLKGLIESYGQTTKRTFESLVRDENIRRSELKDSDGNPAPLASMDKEERGRFFQDFLQNKKRKDINGVKLPGNTKVREIELIPPSKLKFYDAPGISFSKYVSNMSRAIESFKVVGDTRKGEGRLLGKLGKLSDALFTSGQIDQADADLLKSLTELTTTTMAQENVFLRNAGTFTYLTTLVNPGPVIVQFMDQWKVMYKRGPENMTKGLYRTVTGNRRFDLEKDFYFSVKQISAEFDNPAALNKILDTALTWFVPFRQMDTAMKHSSIEATFDDFVSKAKSPIGSKKYNQLLAELTITMGSGDALLAMADLYNGKSNDSIYVKEALLAELLQRQPLTYLQVPEKYQTDPNKRLFWKLQTFMLLDVNYMRQNALNDLTGPGKTLKQRTNALRELTYIGILLTAFGLPKDLLEDWITGKDTYLPDHVVDNLLSIFGMNKYSADQLFRDGPVKAILNRFTPAALNIIVEGGESLQDWISGDKELSELKFWSKSFLSQLWYYRFGAGAKSQEWKKKQKAKEGKYPTF